MNQEKDKQRKKFVLALIVIINISRNSGGTRMMIMVGMTITAVPMTLESAGRCPGVV